MHASIMRFCTSSSEVLPHPGIERVGTRGVGAGRSLVGPCPCSAADDPSSGSASIGSYTVSILSPTKGTERLSAPHPPQVPVTRLGDGTPEHKSTFVAALHHVLHYTSPVNFNRSYEMCLADILYTRLSSPHVSY